MLARPHVARIRDELPRSEAYREDDAEFECGDKLVGPSTQGQEAVGFLIHQH